MRSQRRNGGTRKRDNVQLAGNTLHREFSRYGEVSRDPTGIQLIYDITAMHKKRIAKSRRRYTTEVLENTPNKHLFTVSATATTTQSRDTVARLKSHHFTQITATTPRCAKVAPNPIQCEATEPNGCSTPGLDVSTFASANSKTCPRCVAQSEGYHHESPTVYTLVL